MLSKEAVFVVERRKYPRLMVEVPLDYCFIDSEEEHSGTATNASEGGLLVYLTEDIERGTLLKIEILFPKGSQLRKIKAIAKVVWCDLAAEAAWGEHRYGLEFQSFKQGSLDELKALLREVGETQDGEKNVAVSGPCIGERGFSKAVPKLGLDIFHRHPYSGNCKVSLLYSCLLNLLRRYRQGSPACEWLSRSIKSFR